VWFEIRERTVFTSSPFGLEDLGTLQRPRPIVGIVVDTAGRIQAVWKHERNPQWVNGASQNGLVPITAIKRGIGAEQEFAALRCSGDENCIEAKAEETALPAWEHQHGGRLVVRHLQAHCFELRVHSVEQHDVSPPKVSCPLIWWTRLKKALVKALWEFSPR
jgi:hypothetical protein